MIKKLLIALVPIVAIAILTAGTMSDNGKAGNTGSPSETTCTNCHSSYALNSGIGSVSLAATGITGNQYTPGQTYQMKVTVRYTGRALFGVGLEALNAANTNGGTIIITDPTHTQIKTSNNRNNLVHTLNGGARADSMVFNFAWKAPYKGGGTITFYYCGVAANANGSESGDYVYQGTNLVLTEGACSATAPAAPTSITASANPVCNGLAVTYSTTAVTGATGYDWMFPSGWPKLDTVTTGASVTVNAGTGTGNVTVMAINGCAASAPVTLAVTSTNISTNTSKTNVTCGGGSNGSVSVTASAGVAPYTYSWSNGTSVVGTTSSVSNLPIGTYTVTVTDSRGCIKTASTSLTSPAPIVLVPTGSTVSCTGGGTGSVSVIATGGTTTLPYTYSWKNSGNTVVGTTSTVTGLGGGTYTVTVTDAIGCTQTATATVIASSTINATTSQTNVSCNGWTNGSASVVATGGTTPYTYVWSGITGVVGTTASISNIAAGAYTVTITDAAGCTKTAATTITQPAAINANATSSNLSCSTSTNGSVNVVASGGTGTLTYSWRNAANTVVGTAATVNNLVAGTYTVTITDGGGCTRTASATVTAPAAITATVTSANLTCAGANNGTASVAATGGTGTLTYSWKNASNVAVGTTASISALAAGTYTVTVTDANGCTKTAAATITAPAALTASVSGTNATCNGSANGSVSVTASGGTAPLNYSWKNSANTVVGTTASVSNLVAGAYTVTVTDANGCTITAARTITEPAGMSLTATAPTSVSCFGGTNGSVNVQVTGGTGALSYSWRNSSNSSIGATQTVSSLPAGTYTVTVTDGNGCTKTATATVTAPTAIAATTAATNVSCNGGANGSLTVTASGGTSPYTYIWRNATGTSVGTAASVSSLSAGTYTVTVTDSRSCTQTSTATITAPTAVAITTTATNPNCSGGTGAVSAAVTGGTTPYTYVWRNSTNTSVGTTSSVSALQGGSYTVTVTDLNACTQTATATITVPAPLAATTSTTNVTCYGGTNGSLSVTVAGGTSGYSYNWRNASNITVGTTASVSNQPAGTYTVRITDANACTTTASVSITQPAQIQISIVKTNAQCGMANGSAYISATTPASTYTYSWSNGATTDTVQGLSAGTYTVTVTNTNGCTSSASVTLANTGGPTVTFASSQNASCYGSSDGAASVTVSSGTPPYSYSWSPSGGTAATGTGLAAGAYQISVTDSNGCVSIDSVTITQPAQLFAYAGANQYACSGNYINLSGYATGGVSAYTYSWSYSGSAVASDSAATLTAPTVTALTSADYIITATDANGCSATATTNVQVNPLPLAPTITNGTDTLHASAAISYQWNLNGVPIIGATTADYVPAANGDYTVTVLDTATGCSSTSAIFNYLSTGIIDPSVASGVTMYPNPADEEVVLSISGEQIGSTITVTDAVGRNVYSQAKAEKNNVIRVADFAAGIYAVTVCQPNGTMVTQRLVIR